MLRKRLDTYSLSASPIEASSRHLCPSDCRCALYLFPAFVGYLPQLLCLVCQHSQHHRRARDKAPWAEVVAEVNGRRKHLRVQDDWDRKRVDEARAAFSRVHNGLQVKWQRFEWVSSEHQGLKMAHSDPWVTDKCAASSVSSRGAPVHGKHEVIMIL